MSYCSMLLLNDGDLKFRTNKRIRRNLERSLRAIQARSSIPTDVIVKADGTIYWPQPGESRLPGECLIDTHDAPFWSLAGLEDALRRNAPGGDAR